MGLVGLVSADGPHPGGVDPGGEPVACLSCVAYDDSFRFAGHYIVRPEFRGQGYGIQVWRAGMAHLGTRDVGLNRWPCVPESAPARVGPPHRRTF